MLGDELDGLTMFYLVESHVSPTDCPGFKYELTKDAICRSEFVAGLSEVGARAAKPE